MLRLHPTTITLTGEDISLAMDQLHTSKANTGETSLSSLESFSPVVISTARADTKPSKIHKDLQALLAEEEDCDNIELKHSRFNIQSADLDGIYEHLASTGTYASTAGGGPTGGVVPPLPTPPSEQQSTGGEVFPANILDMQHLDGIPLSLTEDSEWNPREDESVTSSDTGYYPDDRSNVSTPLMSISGGSSETSGQPHSSDRYDSSLRISESPHGMEAEYFITSTFPEFVGPSEPFSLLSIQDRQQVPFQPSPAHLIEIPEAVEIHVESEILSEGSDDMQHQGVRVRRGLGLVYNDAASSNVGEGIGFSPFTYSPDDPEQDVSVVIPEASGVWGNGDDIDSEVGGQSAGGHGWDLRGPRMVDVMSPKLNSTHALGSKGCVHAQGKVCFCIIFIPCWFLKINYLPHWYRGVRNCCLQFLFRKVLCIG
ncbi:hypothetical protein DFH27DRAFT_96972 [Peziza echinospora]|nr:hypothetical protein DFH27DRAFT_96972 [Peziza echinospora]